MRSASVALAMALSFTAAGFARGASTEDVARPGRTDAPAVFIAPQEASGPAFSSEAAEMPSGGDVQWRPTSPTGDDMPPMAPLPPAVIIGPIGIALAGWASYRAKMRGI